MFSTTSISHRPDPRRAPCYAQIEKMSVQYSAAFGSPFSITQAPIPKARIDCPHIRRLQNDPTEPPKSSLNGENQHLNGAPLAGTQELARPFCPTTTKI